MILATLLLAVQGAPDVAERFADGWSALSRGEAGAAELVDLFDPDFVGKLGPSSLTDYLARMAGAHAHAEARAVLPTADGRVEIWFRCGTHEGHVVASARPSGSGLDALGFRREGPFGLPEGMQAGLDADGVAAVVAGWIAEQTLADVFSGAVLLLEGERVLLREGYGLAERRHEVPCRPETRFNVGSISKCFTALAVLQLVAEGVVELDAPLGAYLDAIADAPAGEATVRAALTHTGGLGDYAERLTADEIAAARSPTALLPRLAREPRDAGGAFAYSNTGFLLLGALIEQVAGRSYFDEVERRVFEPLSMAATGHDSLDHGVRDLATGYFVGDDGALWSNERLLLRRAAPGGPSGGPAGGGYSTVDDLGRFGRALLRGDEPSGAAAMVRSLGAAVQTDEPGVRYGFGLEVRETEGCASYGHSGGWRGINALVEVFPSRDLVFVLLANREDAVVRIAPRVRELVARMSTTD